MSLAVSALTINLPTSSLSAREQKMLDRDQQKLRDARSAVEMLKARGANQPREAAEQRKAQARQKVDRLKALLKMMQMGAASNPKALAEIARELKAAIQAYGGTGGSTAGMDAGATTDTTLSNPSVTADGAASAAVPLGTEAVDETPSPTTDDGSHADTGANPSKDGDAAASDPYRRVAEGALARGAEAARSAADQDADREFLSGVRELAAILKSLARRAAQEAKADPSLSADANEAVKASDAVDQAIAATASDLGATGVSILA